MSKAPLDLEQFKSRIQASQSLAKSLVASWLDTPSSTPSTIKKTDNEAELWAPEKTGRIPGLGLGASPDSKTTLLQKTKQDEKLYKQLTGQQKRKKEEEKKSESTNGTSRDGDTETNKTKKRKQPMTMREEDSKFASSNKKKKTGNPMDVYLSKRKST